MRSISGKKRANLRDVARAAGVSVATVSRVLNTPQSVRPETRERVEVQIAELGFFRSAAARAINSGRSKILGALIPTLNSDIFAQTIDAVENRLTELGFSLVVATTAEDREIEARKAQELIDIGVEGLFLSGCAHNDDLHALIKRTRVPAVAISYFDPAYHLPCFGYDNEGTGRAACSFLFEQGHRRIGVLHGPTHNNDRTRARLVGVNLPHLDLILSFYETDLTVDGGCKTISEIGNGVRAFDALLCLNDVLAYGAIFELQRQGVNVPGDISVIGIQDMPVSAAITPRLTTVRLPTEEMGRSAASALAAWVETDIPPDSLCLPTELIRRDSTAPSK